MQNHMKVFEHPEFGEVGVIMIDGKIYFPATECAKTLGYKNPYKAINDHCPHLTKREVGVQTGSKADGTPAYQTVEKTFITEGDLYRLIIRSKLPAAERFEIWVFDEVLPSIRKHGAYINEDVLRRMREDRHGGESNSIQNQKAFLESYAQQKQLINIKHYIDDDESGRFFDRSGYIQMMEDVESGKIGIVIMKDAYVKQLNE